eukprot:GEMP01008513.1.p1 GENE.GEMP01008513.1~~GEMP01008513.1.p1  ORF type:complete len:642 (+),score=137.64 GEMP01008513.1:723-2648(+)
MLNLLYHAQHARSIGSSSCNDRSSRSHCVVQFNVLVVKYSDPLHCSSGALTFVDLAGSERALDTKIASVSTRQLNASLTSLIRLFRQLQEGELRESDRRQSVLNKLIFDYVQPSCGIWLIFCVSCEQEHRESTSSTLQLATDSRNIRLWPQKYTFVKLPAAGPDSCAWTHPVKSNDHVDNVECTSTASLEDATHNINEQLEQCSAMLDKRFEKTDTRFQDYTNLLQSSRNTTSSHLRTLQNIIERRSRLRDSQLHSTRRELSPPRVVGRRINSRVYEECRGNVECSGLDSSWDLEMEFDHVKDERGQDEVIRDLRRLLSAQQADHSESTCLLTNAQDALEHLFTENVGLTEEFLEVLNSATKFLNDVENENFELKQELCDRAEKEKVALTELAEKNLELSDQLAVEDWDAPLEFLPASTPLSGLFTSSSSSTPLRSTRSPAREHESAAPCRNIAGLIGDCAPGRLRHEIHDSRDMNYEERAASRSACSTPGLRGRTHSLLVRHQGVEARRTPSTERNKRVRDAFDDGNQYRMEQVRDGDPYVQQEHVVDNTREPDGQYRTASDERDKKRYYDCHSLRAQVVQCDIPQLSRAIARSASLGRIRTHTPQRALYGASDHLRVGRFGNNRSLSGRTRNDSRSCGR